MPGWGGGFRTILEEREEEEDKGPREEFAEELRLTNMLLARHRLNELRGKFRWN